MITVRSLLLPLLAAMVLLDASGCMTYLEPMKSVPATLGPATAIERDLTTLPPPKEKIVAAVYKFRDQTGQYKNSTTTSTFSTAVTQGATSILLKALEESGWFVVIEREGLSNLLNERQIIRSSRANYAGKEAEQLPPLLFAGVLLEGGIISYETNVLTGGAGVKYFGAGASAQYRQDRVTVYLRATSTQSGRVLKTVYTSKTILSQMVDVNLYRFVKFERLLEAEMGYSYNEPPELCVTEAIQKAVQSLVIEGIQEHLWELKDPKDIEVQVIKDYNTEKNAAARTDYFDHLLIKRDRYRIGVAGGLQRYNGDYPDPKWKEAGSVFIEIGLTPSFSLGVQVGRSLLASRWFTMTLNSGELYGSLRLLPGYGLTPFVMAGASLVNVQKITLLDTGSEVKRKWYGAAYSGAGIECMLTDNLALQAVLDNHYFLSDLSDRLKHGEYNDHYWGLRLGFSWSIGP